MKSDKELQELARDIERGLVFTDHDIEPWDREIGATCFSVIILMSQAERDAFRKQEPYMLYEYMHCALTRMHQGYPTFATVRFLTKEEYAKMITYLETKE